MKYQTSISKSCHSLEGTSNNDSMQFMASSLESLINNFDDETRTTLSISHMEKSVHIT